MSFPKSSLRSPMGPLERTLSNPERVGKQIQNFSNSWKICKDEKHYNCIVLYIESGIS